MKKLALATLVLAVAGTGAFAASLHVPFFVDSAGLYDATTGRPLTAPPPSPAGSGEAGFIGLKNTTAAPIVLTFRYFQTDGTEHVIAPPANTFTLSAFRGIGFRPTVNDAIGEGPIGQAVPPGAAGLPFNVGSLTVSWPGTGTGDVVGRYYGQNVAGNSTSYLFPPGTN